MRFWQLVSAHRGEERLIAAAAERDPEWHRFGEWLADLHGIVRDQERDKLDFVLPREFVRAVLGASRQQYFVSSNDYLRYHRRRDDDKAIGALEAFDRYGGTALEEAQEFGSWPISAGLHREAEWSPPEHYEAEPVQPVRETVEEAKQGIAAEEQAPEPQGGEAQMDDPHDSHEPQAEAEVWEVEESVEDHAPWALRPLLLAGLGLVTGLVVHFLLGDQFWYRFAPSALVMAEVTGITVTAGLIGFTIERRLWWASILFALVMGALAGAVIWWNGGPDSWNGGDGWRVFSLFLGVAIAAPLFQAARDTGEARFPYASVHDHAWTNVVLWFACWVFTGIVFALAYLLAGLFDLIKLSFLSDLLRENWFSRGLVGLAFGGGLGLLREHDVVVRLLQRVVATVLAVLAPVLALGLVVFVLALPFTGLHALWDATTATTPLLLSCIIGALILANAVIGNAGDQERGFPLLRFAAMALAVVMLPLAVIAAIATGLRIGQYGFTPDRLWALTFVVIACAYGLAYLVSVARARLDWAEKVRPANLVLAFVLCGIALVLATPLISFNAISTRDQVARLESGRISPEKFDWQALGFDFGQPGRDALNKLKSSANAAIKAKANETAKAESRYDAPEIDKRVENRAALVKNLRVLPQGTVVPVALLDHLADDYRCRSDGEKCTLVFLGDGKEVLRLHEECFTPVPTPTASPTPTKGAPIATVVQMNRCLGSDPDHYVLVDGTWADGVANARSDAEINKAAAGYKAGEIEVRKVERRQAFVGGVPVGDVFE